MKDESLRSVRVIPENEVLFYIYIKDNFADYFFFHVDYAQYPEDTEIIMALDVQNKIQGMILIWKGRRLQLRGSIKSLEFLLKSKSYSPISVTGFYKHRELIARFFPECKKELALYLMGLNKGDQQDFERFHYKVLTETHREEIVSLMRMADPLFWGSRNPEDIMIDVNNIWFAIAQKERLVSIVGLWTYQKIGYITIVGTHQDYWNKGLASSLISSVLKELFREKEQFFITVRIKNAPAVHLYKKLGFSIYNTQYSYERE